MNAFSAAPIVVWVYLWRQEITAFDVDGIRTGNKAMRKLEDGLLSWRTRAGKIHTPSQGLGTLPKAGMYGVWG